MRYAAILVVVLGMFVGTVAQAEQPPEEFTNSLGMLKVPTSLFFAEMPEDVQLETQKLFSANAAEQIAAAKKLGAMGAKAEPAIEYMIGVLGEKIAGSVRQAILDALVKLGDPAKVQSLQGHEAAELSSAIMSLRGREVVDVFPVAYSSPAVASVTRRTEKAMTSVVVKRLNRAQVAASQVNPAIFDPSTLALVVTIDFLEIPELRAYVFTVRGTVEQVAQLYSSREVSSVTTWSHMELGLIAAAPGGGIRIWESVDAVVDRFIRDRKRAQKAKRVGPKPYGDLFGPPK